MIKVKSNTTNASLNNAAPTAADRMNGHSAVYQFAKNAKKLKANTTTNIIQNTKMTSDLRQENIRTSDITKCCVSTDASNAENRCPAIISIRNVKIAKKEKKSSECTEKKRPPSAATLDSQQVGNVFY